MEIVNKNVVDLIPYEKNPRKNEEAVPYVAESIKRFGFKVPIIIDANNVIVCGHTRLRAAKSLGLKQVPCIVADDLTDEQIAAFRLADNRVSEFSKWDEELLAYELADIVDINMEDLGFDTGEEDEEEPEVKPEYEFTEELLEQHNYIVLYFENELDWQVALERFKITQKKALGNPKKPAIGIGRVINGAKALGMIDGSVE